MSSNLQQRRLAAGLSQAKLAKRLGITTRYISALETGDRTPGFKLAKKIADTLGSSVDKIFFDDTTPDSGDKDNCCS